MEMLDHSRILRRGRHRPIPHGFTYSKTRQAAGLSALLLLMICSLWLGARAEHSGDKKIVVAQGQIQLEPDFARSRGFIRYRIAGTGKRYWYGTIAERFGVAGGWKGIAATTLDPYRKLNGAEVEKSQYRLETGQEVKIPIRDPQSR